jgi:hypothetical protein
MCPTLDSARIVSASCIQPCAEETFSTDDGRKVVLRFADPKSYDAAQRYCRDNGGELVTLRNADDTALLAQAINSVATGNPMWVGLRLSRDADITTGWQWASTNQQAHNISWGVNEPYDYRQDNGDLDGLCATFYPSEDGGFFASGDCAPEQGYVCQIGE